MFRYLHTILPTNIIGFSRVPVQEIKGGSWRYPHPLTFSDVILTSCPVISYKIKDRLHLKQTNKHGLIAFDFDQCLKFYKELNLHPLSGSILKNHSPPYFQFWQVLNRISSTSSLKINKILIPQYCGIIKIRGANFRELLTFYRFVGTLFRVFSYTYKRKYDYYPN